MFERFTAAARAAVTTAAASAGGSATITVDHLVAALLPGVLPSAPPAGPAAPAAVDHVLADLAAARRRAGLSPVDAHALAEFGIDVDAVVDAAERELGVGALATGERGRRGRRRQRLDAASRAALVASLHQARASGDRELRVEHLMLGVLSQRADRVPADVLAAHGITTATLLQQACHGAA